MIAGTLYSFRSKTKGNAASREEGRRNHSSQAFTAVLLLNTLKQIQYDTVWCNLNFIVQTLES